MTFELRLDAGGAVGVFVVEDGGTEQIESLGTPGSDLDTGRTAQWLGLQARPDAAVEAALEAKAPDVLAQAQAEDTGDASPFDHESEEAADYEQTEEKGRVHFTGTAPAELTRFLKYHKVDYGAFQPHEARFYAGLRDLLALHDVVGADETLDHTTFGPAVEAFQAKKKLSVDGLPGRDTLWAMQSEWAASRALPTVRIGVDKWYYKSADNPSNADGFDRFTLREDAATAFEAFYAELQALGGVVTSAGSLRKLTASVGSSRSTTSMHLPGIAFDLATGSGFERNRDADPYRIERDRKGRGWRVWCRSESADYQTLIPCRWRGGKVAEQDEEDTAAFDFTALAEKHGFYGIGPRKGSSYSHLEWWHFQYEGGLVPFVSQFGAELLSMERYNLAFLSRQNLWSNARRIFKSRNRGWH